MDRAFVDPASGDTTCVWLAPSQNDVESMFAAAGVEYKAITAVEEVTAADTP